MMIIKPKFITFTGADEHTSIEGMCALAGQYPIEWGLLFSPTRQGSGRYPTFGFITDLLANHYTLNFSAHLCGGHSRSLLRNWSTEVDDFIRGRFSRVQVNTTETGVDTWKLSMWGRRIGAKPILQCRGQFPSDRHVAWLFDASGGRGIEPDTWPRAPRSANPKTPRMVGYAGGLGPKNVTKHLESISKNAFNFWIDMESAVRDDADRFDLAKCRAVCEAVYGT